jgi:NAD(P)-dependent dehydrogenase (short-subunit alcohol dehydrogenase family)
MTTISVVTGANSGIGRATAIHLAAQGHTVYGVRRDKAGKLLAMATAAGVDINLVELGVPPTSRCGRFHRHLRGNRRHRQRPRQQRRRRR